MELGGQIIDVTGFAPGQWSWASATIAGVTATLSIENSGVYTVNLLMREDGLRIDRLVLTTDTTFIPTGFGPAETERQLGGGPLIVPITRTIVYTYDNLYRLTAADYTSGENYQYSYDPVGNRLEQVINGDTTAYLYDAANRLEQLNGQSVYTFDNNGNLLNSDVLTNTWDAANRLVETQRDGATVVPIYNGVGDRVGQTIGLSTTHFALDVQGLPEVIYTSEGNAYLHLPGVIMAESAEGEVRYLLSDGLGSVRQGVDETGAVVAYNEFDPYGNPVQNDSTPYGFTGEWWEEDVELLHLRARWYAPDTGTFLSVDSVEGEPPYQYVRGNPVNLTDPSGMLGCKGLTGEALEVCEEALEQLQKRVDRLVVDIEMKFQVVRNSCQMLVSSVRPRVRILVNDALTYYDNGRDEVRNQLGLDNRIDQSNPTIPFTGIKVPFSNPGEGAMLALLGEDRAYLGGDAIDLIRADPAMIAYEQGLVNSALSDPRYRRQTFSFRDRGRMQFGGERSNAAPMRDQILDPLNPDYRATWDVGLNELTWLIRSVTIGSSVQVTMGGTVNMLHSFEDTLDLRPNRDSNSADGQAYNAITTGLGFLYHDVARGTEMKIEAHWTSSYP